MEPLASDVNSKRLKLATVWLGGCSGCHMSFLDLDEWLFELAMFADVVFTPLVDIKEYPKGVDAVLVEGAVANKDNLEFIRLVRERTKWVLSFGDCAVTGNVTALRNTLGDPLTVLERSYLELADINPRLPDEPDILPPLLERVEPVHRVVHVDGYIPGCPPPADRIRKCLEALRKGRLPELEGQDVQFG